VPLQHRIFSGPVDEQSMNRPSSIGQDSAVTGRSTGPRAIVNSIADTLFERGGLFDLLARMTLILLALRLDSGQSLLQTRGDWYLKLPILTLSIAGIAYAPLTRKASFWFLVTFIVAAAHIRNWHSIDNHKYLITYWCLSIACSLLTSDPRQFLAINARLLIGLSFAFATLWKVISPEFLNGTFFHFTLLTDQRFLRVFQLLGALHIGGVANETIIANRNAFISLLHSHAPLMPVQLHDILWVGAVARVMAWWTVLVEGSVAVAFLWPARRRSIWRDVLLVVFIVTTYPVASVVGFGWIVAILGIAQTTSGPAWRLIYLAFFATLPLAELPYGSLIKRLM
jgi:hypothetical protein